jgi:hypothetical protein
MGKWKTPASTTAELKVVRMAKTLKGAIISAARGEDGPGNRFLFGEGLQTLLFEGMLCHFRCGTADTCLAYSGVFDLIGLDRAVNSTKESYLRTS